MSVLIFICLLDSSVYRIILHFESFETSISNPLLNPNPPVESVAFSPYVPEVCVPSRVPEPYLHRSVVDPRIYME